MVRMNQPNDTSRRDFFRAGATGALLAGAPILLKGAPAGEAIKVGLVGCGGRGTGAANQALHADDYSVLTAVADVSQDNIDKCLDTLRKQQGDKAATKVAVDKPKQFVGLDAFEKLIASDVDVVLLATPPGFRPAHLRRAIEANKNVFCEKPIATDAPGVRHVLETVKMAKAKNLNLVAGFCWRYSNYIVEAFDQIHQGAIGDIVAYYATYYTSPVKPMPPASTRPAGISDIEWQIRNWYNFSWLCGDSIVEQAVHSVDKIAWAMKDQPPVSCVAVGGRQIPAEGGNIYDHFEVNYLYPNGTRAFMANRQIEGCYNENSDYILGTEGVCTIGRGPNPRITGKTKWSFEGQKYDMYQKEHDELFAAIRKNQPINDGNRMATSTLLAMMGRMAAYTGQEITWDQALNSQETLSPGTIDWKGSFTPSPLPRPGITKYL
ncbi:MAG TPA: Gfo/Idh/MocA family oxidoreductase [Bryobacteraceae bacterium]|nr:Gfo/Idh/MocA family oxidoreductase [Bryobacteraceae bacterium]